jgi:hypothetical protein
MRPLTGVDKGGMAEALGRSSDPVKTLDRHDMVGVVLDVPDPGPVAADRNDFIVRVAIVAGPDEVADAEIRRTVVTKIEDAKGCS